MSQFSMPVLFARNNAATAAIFRPSSLVSVSRNLKTVFTFTSGTRILYIRQNSTMASSVTKAIQSPRDHKPSLDRFSTLVPDHLRTKDRSYKNALRLLDSIASNRVVTTAVGSSSDAMNDLAIPEMVEWFGKAGYEIDDLERLRCIHVAGTKGKGSVCAIINAVLAGCNGSANGKAKTKSRDALDVALEIDIRRSSEKQGLERDADKSTVEGTSAAENSVELGPIGMYTSPHLISPRERIQINNRPVSQVHFARSFFKLWDNFSYSCWIRDRDEADPSSAASKPGYFRFLTIMAFDIFLNSGVRTAIIECGIGGEYDSTNILPPSSISVAAITTLGIDHTAMLGNTLKEIAWHKAGIMKHGKHVYSTFQDPIAMSVLQQRAKEKGASFHVMDTKCKTLKLEPNLRGEFQIQNAQLAVAVAGQHLENLGLKGLVTPKEIDGTVTALRCSKSVDQSLKWVNWPGRCHKVRDLLDNGDRSARQLTWYLDGAHNVDSLKVAAEWFGDQPFKRAMTKIHPKATRKDFIVLIFNQELREASDLLRFLIKSFEAKKKDRVKLFHLAIFCPNVVYSSGAADPSTDAQSFERQFALKKIFDEELSSAKAYSRVENSIESAVNHIRKIYDSHRLDNGVLDKDRRIKVFATGSLHLVGGLLQVLHGLKETDEDYL